MESLSEQQRQQIRKMSDDRLRDNLRKAGMPDAAIIALDRPSLLAAWAELVATGRVVGISLRRVLGRSPCHL